MPSKIYSNKSVYEAAQERLKYIFDTFENVLSPEHTSGRRAKQLYREVPDIN